MATTLKRSLFIGLGGTGASALLHTKKRFLDTYGEVPPMISFLTIDTDFNTQTKSIKRDSVLEGDSVTSNEVTFDKSELLYIKVQGATDAYDRQRESLFSWMPPKSEYALRNLLNGAGQVRSNGRFALHFNYRNIIDSVQAKINNLLNITHAENNLYEAKGSDIEINFVFSVGGGTGSGVFADIAYLVKEAIGNVNTTSIAFVVLPDVFTSMKTGISMQNVKPNGYGALKDLDFLMRKDINKLNLDLEYQDKTIQIKSNPFDVVFTVNNLNTAGEKISDISEISEQIGLAMFTGASELSAGINSAYDNVITILNGGALDIENKRAWAGGMGVSELFYNGNTLGNIYARRAIASMIINLLTASNSSQKLANDFIDHPEIQIRENDGNDYLIDSLLPKQPSIQFPEIDEVDDLNNIINVFINDTKKSSQNQISANYNIKYNRVLKGFKNKVNEIINADSGVANATVFLSDLNQQLDIFLDEMTDEEQELKKEQVNLESVCNSELQFLATNTGFSSIFKKSDINSAKSNLGGNINHQAVLINEILRRQFAQNFINALKSEINNYNRNINTLTKRLHIVKDQSQKKAANLQNNVNDRRKTFVVDLHKEEINNIYVEENDYIIEDFIEELNTSNKLYDLHSISDESVIENYFWNYTKKLDRALAYKRKSIDDILRDLSEEKRNNIAKQLISKSSALWSYDMKGYKIGNSIHDDFVIGLPSENSSFKDTFSTLINAQNISFVHTGINNKIVCYRMETAVPIYAVNDIAGYEKEYKISKRISHHIDQNWVTRMARENFSIWPEEKEDHSLEAWVLGFVYGFIKFENDKYQIYSRNKGVPLKKYWLELSGYRDDAFDLFVKDDYISEMIDLVEDKRKQSGDDATKELMLDVIENYHEKYSQMNLSVDELGKKEYTKIAELINKEIDFTVKELSKLK